MTTTILKEHQQQILFYHCLSLLKICNIKNNITYFNLISTLFLPIVLSIKLFLHFWYNQIYLFLNTSKILSPDTPSIKSEGEVLLHLIFYYILEYIAYFCCFFMLLIISYNLNSFFPSNFYKFLYNSNFLNSQFLLKCLLFLEEKWIILSLKCTNL